MKSLKRQLYDQCQAYIDRSIHTIQQALDNALNAAREETKSSVGDKYETGRAMMQIEAEKNASQLTNLQKMAQVIRGIDPEKHTSQIALGSVTITSLGSFYISISAGLLVVDNKSYFAVSPASPIGSKLMGLSAGDAFEHDKKPHTVASVQ